MTTTAPPLDLDELERLARAAETSCPSPWLHGGGHVRDSALWRVDFSGAALDYAAALDPRTALALIERLRRAEAAAKARSPCRPDFFRWGSLTMATETRAAEILRSGKAKPHDDEGYQARRPFYRETPQREGPAAPVRSPVGSDQGSAAVSGQAGVIHCSRATPRANVARALPYALPAWWERLVI